MVTGALQELQLLPNIIRGFFRDPALNYINWPLSTSQVAP